jgi:DNA-binding LacI/PurR family transcriptional regulator
MAKISDVAKIAGVSPATVSRVFNQPGLVVSDKRDRVLEAVRQLDYKPSQAARNLRAGAANTITVLVGDISQLFHASLSKALSRVGETRGYRILIYDLDHSEERLIRALNDLKTSDTYGIVLATGNDLGTNAVMQAVTAAQSRGIFIVSTSQQTRPTLPAVMPRYRAISHMATLHLAAHGCERMIFLGSFEESPLSRDRLSGFEHACSELGFDEDARFVLNGHRNVDISRSVFDNLLKSQWIDRGERVPLLGVVSITMRMAIGVLQAAADNGLDVPGQVSVVCCENTPLATELRPPVTTVGVDFDVLAETTFSVLLRGKDAPPVTHLPHRLVIRSSSQRS